MIILIPLFAVNAIFNLRYEWGGVSTIARVYIMVLSFYMVFIFSQINVDMYRADYASRYGWKGKYYLFGALRIFPFLFIYLLTVIFVLINYLDSSNWPTDPIYRLLDGRYSNTVIYPLILFIVLTLKKRPGISIPLFIIFSVLYYATDQTLYTLFEPGLGINVIKFIKYFIFTFVLVYEYSKSQWKLFQALILSFITGLFLYSVITSFIAVSFYTSSQKSHTCFITANILLKSGFTFTLKKLGENIAQNNSPENTRVYFEYLKEYKKDSNFTNQEWEELIQNNKIEEIEYIFEYLNLKKIKLNFEMLKDYSVAQMLTITGNTVNLNEFTRYLALYYNDYKNDFYDMYKSENEPVKLMILESLGYTDDVHAVKFLTDKLTSVERLRSEAAYKSLKKITGEDPASVLKTEKYDLDIVLFFRDYASKMKK
jgi:hypothetical protein